MVECGGLEIRCTARYRGFESLSLRNKGCKSASYAIYTLFYTQELRKLRRYQSELLVALKEGTPMARFYFVHLKQPQPWLRLKFSACSRISLKTASLITGG